MYIVHQGALIKSQTGYTSMQDHKILGVYIDRALANAHHDKITENLLFGDEPYVAVTKHTIRDKLVNLGDIIIL